MIISMTVADYSTKLKKFCHMHVIASEYLRYYFTSFQVLAIPAIPLTMSAGLLFGSVTGTIIVSVSGTVSNPASIALVLLIHPLWLQFLTELYYFVASCSGRLPYC